MDYMGLAALIVAITGLLGAAGGLIKLWYDLHQVSHAVNHRLDQLVDAKGAEQRAEGKEEGRAIEVARDKSADPSGS